MRTCELSRVLRHILDQYKSFGIAINSCTAQKMKFSTNDFFCKFDQIRRKLQIWSHLQNISFTENVFCVVLLEQKINKQINDFGNSRGKKKQINKRIIKQKKKNMDIIYLPWISIRERDRKEIVIFRWIHCITLRTRTTFFKD